VSHIVSELEALGYRWAHRVVGLTGFGLPQRRRRCASETDEMFTLLFLRDFLLELFYFIFVVLTSSCE